MSARRNATGPSRPVRRVPTVLGVNAGSCALGLGADCGAPTALTTLLPPAVRFRQPGLMGKTATRHRRYMHNLV